MGFWPFGASKKSRKRNTTDQATTTLLEKSLPEPMARHARPTSSQGTPRSGRPDSRQGRDDKARRLSKPRPHTYKTNQSYNLPHSQTAPVGSPSDGSALSDLRRRNSYLYQQQAMSQTSIGPDHFTAVPQVPTLYAKRSDFDPSMPRRKSSKRKAGDHARERELRAMSSPVPVPKLKRPMTYSGSGPLQRETKNVPGDLNRQLRRPTSQVSLPVPENISETGESLPQNSFKVGMLAALSPRPMIRYEGRSRSSFGKQPARLDTLQQSVEEDHHSAHIQRIDELADELDSAGLRELMERDKKRREKRKEAEKAKLTRKLQRRADKQREEETRRTRAEEFARTSQANLHELRQTNRAEPASEPPSSPTAVPTLEQSSSPQTDPFVDPDDPKLGPGPAIRNPFDDEKDLDVMHEPSDNDEGPETAVAVKSPGRAVAAAKLDNGPEASSAAISPPTSPIQHLTDERNLSQVSFNKENISPEAAAGLERQRQPSDQSGPQVSTWTRFFSRGGRRKSSTPDHSRPAVSEFSNTSRESFARKPPPIVTAQRTFRRSESATPQRTMSRFREDLPEYPISPPDSRMQSPESTAPVPIKASSPSSRHPNLSVSGTLDSLATDSSMTNVERGRPDSRVHSALSGESEGPGHVLSRSLASVDSEGSWLSGRPVKRYSGPMSPAAIASDAPHKTHDMEEDLAQDEYLSRLSPEPDHRRQSGISSGRRPSSALIDLQQESSTAPDVPSVPPASEEGEKWHSSIGRQPTVVKPATRAKSREGLLNDFQTAQMGEMSDDESESPKSEEEVPIMRARSVEYKGHVRRVSAGSARVLDIRRSSVQSTGTPPRSPALRSASAVAVQEATKAKAP